MTYLFQNATAFDPYTGEGVPNATGQVFALSDTDFLSPLPVTMLSSGLQSTELVSDQYSQLPGFDAGDNLQVVFKSGEFTKLLNTSTPLPGPVGPSAYGVAVENGYTGTEAEYNATLADAGNLVARAETAEQAAIDAAGLVGAPAGSAVLAAISEGGAARGELNAAIDEATLISPTAGAAMRTAGSGTAPTAVLTGHSLLYGQDTSASGTLPPVNGATHARSATPTTQTFAEQAAFTAPAGVTVVNQAFPGDRTTEALSRWASGASGDLEFFWLDTNDAMNYAGYAGGALTDAQTLANFKDLVKRAVFRGAQVVVVGGAPVTSDSATRKIYAAAETDRTIAERHGAMYVDAGELLTALPIAQPLNTDGVHLSPAGYSLVGSRLAALVGPKGVKPPKVSPGRRITVRDKLHFGGATMARGGAMGDLTTRITEGQTIAISVDVEVPCIPVHRFYVTGTGNGYGDVGLYSNLTTSGQPRRVVTLPVPTTSTGNAEFVYIPAQPLLSPGPDSLVIKAESGVLEWDSTVFVPITSGRFLASLDPKDFFFSRTRDIQLRAVGGRGQRADANWDATIDTASGIALKNSGTAVGVNWKFDLTLGTNYSGAILAQYVRPSSSLVEVGHMILRHGSSLIVRKLVNGTVTDTTVADAFPLTGIVRAVMGIVYDPTADTLVVSIDGVEKATVAAPGYGILMAGLLAGTASGGGYASGTATAYMATTNAYV